MTVAPGVRRAGTSRDHGGDGDWPLRAKVTWASGRYRRSGSGIRTRGSPLRAEVTVACAPGGAEEDGRGPHVHQQPGIRRRSDHLPLPPNKIRHLAARLLREESEERVVSLSQGRRAGRTSERSGHVGSCRVRRAPRRPCRRWTGAIGKPALRTLCNDSVRQSGYRLYHRAGPVAGVAIRQLPTTSMGPGGPGDGPRPIAGGSVGARRFRQDQARSNRSSSITLVQAATKSVTNFSRASSLA